MLFRLISNAIALALLLYYGQSYAKNVNEQHVYGSNNYTLAIQGQNRILIFNYYHEINHDRHHGSSEIFKLLSAVDSARLSIQSVREEEWLGSTQEYLTVALKNNGRLPATNIKISILYPLKPGEKESKRMFLLKPNLPNIKIIRDANIPYESSALIPVVSMPYIESKFHNAGKYKLIGVGLSPTIEHCRSDYCMEVPYGISVSYKSLTIKKRILSFFYLYYELISGIDNDYWSQ